MSPLPSDERRALLDLARRAIVLAVEQRGPLELTASFGSLGQPAGAFVTLRRRGRLRGCIGQVEAHDPLAHVVARCAASAALEDPRFEPVGARELSQLEIEISVLSALMPISPAEIEVGKHGLVVTRERYRGVLLPQVPIPYRWTAERFLEETCLKGGLERHAWRDPETRIQSFTAEVFSEADLAVSRETTAGEAKT